MITTCFTNQPACYVDLPHVGDDALLIAFAKKINKIKNIQSIDFIVFMYSHPAPIECVTRADPLSPPGHMGQGYKTL